MLFTVCVYSFGQVRNSTNENHLSINSLCKTWSLSYRQLPPNIKVINPVEEAEYPTITFTKNGTVYVKSRAFAESGSWHLIKNDKLFLKLEKTQNIFTIQKRSSKDITLKNTNTAAARKYLHLFNPLDNV